MLIKVDGEPICKRATQPTCTAAAPLLVGLDLCGKGRIGHSRDTVNERGGMLRVRGKARARVLRGELHSNKWLRWSSGTHRKMPKYPEGMATSDLSHKDSRHCRVNGRLFKF